MLVDAPASFSERTLTALDTCDLICLVTSGSLPSLKATRRCLVLFDTLGVSPDRVRLILNHSTPRVTDVASVATVLGRRPDFVIRNSPALDQAANTGKPLVTADPADPLVADLRNLAGSILVSVPPILAAPD